MRTADPLYTGLVLECFSPFVTSWTAPSVSGWDEHRRAGFAPDGFNVPWQGTHNNVSEREMKRIVLNRKNTLFVGNERGGRTAAILSSFTSTCRRHGIDPQRYLTQLLTNLPATPISQIEQWLPDRWKRRNPAS